MTFLSVIRFSINCKFSRKEEMVLLGYATNENQSLQCSSEGKIYIYVNNEKK